MDNISGQVIKGYELQELIGAGGFGAVYKAYQPLVKRDVAIKIILPDYANQPDFIRRFEVEAQLVARLEHIHIVPLYDYWREPGGAYLVMRWLRGGSLRGLVKKGPLELANTGRLLDHIASALATAHRQGVIHRDLKPDNILLDEDGNAYLADFGIALEVDAPVDPEEAELVIGSPAYISPEQIMTEPATPLSDIYSLGIVLFEMLTGKEPFSYSPTSSVLMKHLHEPLPNLQSIRPELPQKLNDVVQKATSKKPEDRYADALLLAADFHRSLNSEAQSSTATMIGLPPVEIEELYEPENPYKGLRAFQEADADDFFGREALVEQLLRRLGEAEVGSRFLAVVGPSGSGKSSTVKAGVIPALRRGALPTSDQWYTLEIVPGTHPFEELEAALLRVAINPPASLLEVFREDERGLTRAIKRILPGSNDELLLIIDQFEELFTMVNDESERAHFLKSILAAASDERSRLRIIVTLRADFYDRPLLYPEFGELIRKRTEIVLPLSAEELTRAIASPAERVGLKLEAGLAATIVAEIGEQPGALPLLQYALSELFERRSGRTLTLQAYHESGKVLGALARRADELYEALNDTGKQAARQLFLRLVTPGEGAEDTRRRVQQSEISGGDAVQNVIESFGKYRLLTFDRDPMTRVPTIEVAHEALIRQWGRLRGWIDESRESVRLQRRLTTAADEWFNANRETSFLLSGSRLEQFESWSKETDLMLSEREAEYLAASITEREKRQAEEEARQANERLLELRSRQRLRALVAVMLVATIIALGLTGFAFSQQQIAQQNADMAATAQEVALNEADKAATAAAVAELSAAESRSLALASGAQLALSGDNTDLAIALALEANRGGQPTIQTQRTLANAAYAPGTRRIFAGHNDRVLSVAFSPDGATALSASTDHTLILWNVATGEMIRRFEGHRDWVRAVNFSADGKFAVSASSDYTIILWDVATGEIIHRFEGHTGVVYDAVFNGSATRILSASADRTLILWDAQTGELIRRLEGNTAEVLSVAFSASGFTALSGSRDSKVILWNVQSGQPILEFEGHQGRVNSVAFSPDEQFALSGAEDRTLILWSFETGQIASRLTGHTAQIHSVAFSPDGQSAVSAGEDNTVILWNLGTGAVRRRFLGHTQVVSTVRFSPDGRQLLSGSWDGSLRLWDISSGAEISRFDEHTDAVNAVAFSPDGRVALSASMDGTLIEWNLESREVVRRFEGNNSGVNCAVFSPDGKTILSGAEDAMLTLWDAETGKIIRQFEGHSDAVLAAAFSPDGTRAVSGSRDNTVILWNIQTGEQIHRFIGHTFRVTGVAFSPNGERVVSSAFDNTLILWDTGTGESIRRFEGHTDWVRAVAFSPDGRFILSGSSDNSLILWDAATGERIKRFEGHTAQILSVAFSPDGRRAISASSDTLVIVWDIESGAELGRLEGHSDAVNAVAFSPDGRFALSGSADRTTRLWQVSATLDELIAWTQANRYVRDLTCVEREQYRVEPLCPAPTPIFTPNAQSV